MNSKIDLRATFVKGGIRLLSKCGFFKRSKKPIQTPHFLIVSTTGVGDTLWGTPAIQTLKKAYPDSKVHVLTSPLGHQILLNNPSIDQLYLFKKSSFSLLSLFRTLRKKRFEAIFFFHVSHRWLIPFCYFAARSRLIGFDRHAKSFSSLLTDVHQVGLRHPILQRLSLIQSITKIPQKPDTQIQIFLTPQEKEQAASFLERKGIKPNRLLIGLQPGASQPFKQWPVSHFISLVQKLRAKLDCEFIVFGNANERLLAENIQREVFVHMATGELSLRVSAALIGKLDLLVTNDTGPMHLALAQQIKTVAIFSPTFPDLCWPHQQAPWVRVLYLHKTCISCIGHKCYKPYCMERIDPLSVSYHCLQLLNTPLGSKNSSEKVDEIASKKYETQ